MFDKLIENFPKILRALTLWRAVLVAILAFVFTALYITWDARQVVVQAVKAFSIGNPPRNALIAEEGTVQLAKAIVDRSPLVTAIELINTDFRSNTRTTAFFYSDRHDLQALVDSAIASRVSPAVLFMTSPLGATPEQASFVLMNNQRVIEIMSAAFVCADTSTTMLSRMAPEVVPLTPVICSISIPPYAGKFSGYMNLYLTRQPTEDERQMLRDASRSLASDIFDRQTSR